MQDGFCRRRRAVTDSWCVCRPTRKLYEDRVDAWRLSLLEPYRTISTQSSFEVNFIPCSASALSVESERHLRTECSNVHSHSRASSCSFSLCADPLNKESSCSWVERTESQEGILKMSSKDSYALLDSCEECMVFCCSFPMSAAINSQGVP